MAQNKSERVGQFFENVFTLVQKCIITDMNLFFQFTDFIAKKTHEGGTVQAPREL